MLTNVYRKKNSDPFPILENVNADLLFKNIAINMLHTSILFRDIKLCIVHLLCEQCLHNLHFLKKGSFSPNLPKLARAHISCHFLKKGSLCRTVFSMNGLYQ